jgi:2-haloacid dehalogenase
MESVAPGMAPVLLHAYHALEPEIEEERPFRRYREVLAITLRRAADQAGIRLAAGAEHVLSDTLPDWPVFPDVPLALTTLRANGCKLAILSNVDRDLIAGTLQHIPVPFDDVITAEDVRAYKPAAAHFERFRSIHAPVAGHWVHVARSYFHDIQTAHQLGIPSVWINRGADIQSQPLATAVLPDLQALPETVRGLLQQR